MGASTQDMVNQLLAQTTVAPQPSFAGIQAPPNPAQLQQLLAKLQQQQFLQQQSAPTPGQYGYLHDAGTGKGMIGLGQQLGNVLTGPAQQQQPPQQGVAPAASGAGSPAAPGSPAAGQAQISQAIQQAKMLYAAQIKQGADPDQAKLTTLKYMASAGVPGADDKLAEAQTALLGNNFKKAESAKDSAQAAMDTAAVPQKDIDNQSKQWKTTYTDPNGYYMLQTNGNGEVRRTELKPNMASLLTAPPEQQASIAKMIANYDMAPLSSGALRSAGGQAIMAQVHAVNPDYDETQYQSKSATMKGFSGNGKDSQAVKSFNVGLSHLDTLSEAATALNNGPLTPANKAANAIAAWTGGTAPTNFEAVKGIVSNEITKAIIGSAGGVTDREEAKAEISSANSPAQLQQVIQKYQALMAGQLAGLRTKYESTGRKDFEGRFLEPRAVQIAHSAKEYTSVFPNAQTPAAPPSSGWGQATVTKQ